MPYANCDIKMFTYVHEWLPLPSYCLHPLSKPTIVKMIQDNLSGSIETRTADLENGCDCDVLFFFLPLPPQSCSGVPAEIPDSAAIGRCDSKWALDF